jgi:hypothetical protein
MKHIKLFEQFINESLKAKKPNDIIEIDIDFAGSDSDLRKLSKKHKLEVDEYQSGMVLLKGKKKDILDYLQSDEYDMDPEDIKDLFSELLESDTVTIKMNRLNENVLDIAMGVAIGLTGLWALVKGTRVVGNVLGNAAEYLADKAEAKSKQAAKGQRKELIEEIIKKFEGDKELERMYQELPEYSSSARTKIMIDQNKQRTKQLTAIGNYIKSKLTPEEMKYFADISSMLRTGDVL